MQIIAAIVAAILVLLLLRTVLTRDEATFSRRAADASAIPPTEASIRDCLLRGRKIQAIKAYRELHRVDLKTAKEAVERLAEQLPPTP
jgi:ribosomal protein L7/L12